jgi:AraC-like DNA-binding protein
LDTSFRRLKQSIIEEIAKDALLNSPTSVTEVALKLGYAESAAFARAFKKNTGLTPMEYRRTMTVRR